MRKYFKTLLLVYFILIINQFLFAQTKDNFFERQYVVADVNFDNIKDVIQIYQDTINSKAVYRLEISLAEIDSVGKYEVVSTEKAIKPDFPDAETIDDRFWSGEMFDRVEVENGILLIRFNLMRGYYVHKYKFKDNSFELIYVKRVTGSPDYLEEIDYDLLSGERKTKIQEGSKKPVISKVIHKISPLPKLGEFIPFENKHY